MIATRDVVARGSGPRRPRYRFSGLLVAILLAIASPAAADDRPRPVAFGAEVVSTAEKGARCIGRVFDDTAAFQAALDTGRTVYAPALGGHCRITRALTMRTPGQILHGDGRARTRLEIAPGFAGAGVFVAATGEPGPVWRDLAVAFAQPDVAERARLTRYPPAFLARATPRFEIEHVGCYAATTCIDMTGNSGGATISDFQMSAFETGIDIDGSLDTVRVIDPHWWPFALSPAQQKLFMSQGADRPVALQVGRMDDLVIRGGLFLGGLALHARAGKTGPMFGTITGTDFDTTSGIVMEAGSLQIASAQFTLGFPDAQAIRQSGGDVAVSATMFFAGSPLDRPLIENAGGRLTIVGSQVSTLYFDVTALRQSGETSFVMLSSNIFTRTAGRPYARPTVDLGSGSAILVGNYCADKGAGSGVFLKITDDNRGNRIMGNSSVGWKNIIPEHRLGTFLFN